MRPSRLFLCFLIASDGLTAVVEAQPCYKRTSEFVIGNNFVKPMTDSTCFGQWYHSLRYYNFKTGVTLFSFLTEQYYPHPHFGNAWVSDILMFDSLLVVSWEGGDVYRILNVDFHGVVSEIPTALDSIPLLKFGTVGTPRGRKLTVVNASVFLMSSRYSIYSFLRFGTSVTCIDSMSIYTVWPEADGARDMYGDTIVLLSSEDNETRFYHVDANGKITYSASAGLDNDESWWEEVFFRFGNLFVGNGSFWRALMRTPEGFKLAPGSAEDWSIGDMVPLFGNENVVFISYVSDEMWVYDRELNLLCNKPPVSSPGWYASGIYGNKVFTANSDGIRTWIPDTSTTSVTSHSVANHPSGIEVWPNPSVCGTITVSSEEPATAIELTDAGGRTVYRASQPGVGATIIPTALLPAGVYFVTAQTAQGMVSARVVILGSGK